MRILGLGASGRGYSGGQFSGRPRRPGLEAQTADAREVTALAVAAGETGDLRRTGTPGEDTLGEGVFAGCPRTWGSGTAPPSRLHGGA